MAGRLPKRIAEVGRTDTLTLGARKALGNMIEKYGRTDGERIFLAKASEKGQGKTLRQKVNFTYKTGAKLK